MIEIANINAGDKVSFRAHDGKVVTRTVLEVHEHTQRVRIYFHGDITLAVCRIKSVSKTAPKPAIAPYAATVGR